MSWMLAALLAAQEPERPNIILCMADDQGWGDTGYGGHPRLKTPHLDAMSREGLRFERWYAAAPVCSPTRGSVLTGRHPYRYGIFSANVGHLRKDEITLAERLKAAGYATGHFGKWHLGTLSRDEKDGRRGGRKENDAHYAPPWEHGFDACFSTEVQMPTWDPVRDQTVSPTRYWTGPGQAAADNLEGDDSRVILDRALPFIRAAAEKKTPFFTVIWFHTPHEPVRGGGAFMAEYQDAYLACLSALDAQMGGLRRELAALGLAENTMLWYASDNGPEHAEGPGSAGPLRGRKRSLYEGGVRTPGLLVWPAKIKTPRSVSAPCVTSDYLPTILDVLGLPPEARPIDGISLRPLIEGTSTSRNRPIGFESGEQLAWMEERYKLIRPGKNKPFELYDLVEDPAESKDLAAAHPGEVERMSKALDAWRSSCRASLQGQDYR